MATSAVVSKDTVLKVKIGNTWTKVVELKDFSGLFSGTGAIIDATHLDSSAKEKLMGITDEGSHKFTFNYVPADAGQNALIVNRQSSTLTEFQLTNTRAAKVHTYKGWVMSTEITGGVDKVQELSVTVEVTDVVGTAAVA